MTDDQMVLDAAKAAGIKVLRAPDGSLRNCTSLDPAANIWAAPHWSPLTDDGDSARLRRALRIVVQWFPTDVAAMNWSDGRGRSWAEPYGNDPAAAERRAVVRAAAALKDTA